MAAGSHDGPSSSSPASAAASPAGTARPGSARHGLRRQPATATDVDAPDGRFGARLQHDLRRMAAAATAGLVAGFVVNGVGSRLAMLLLARLNPQATGLISDDGFRIGQFTLADTVGLVVFGTGVGVLGGLVFLVLRGLRVGPRWFRTTSMTVGPAVVVGSVLVHSDGIDFRLLEPTWLAVGLFVVLPGVFAWWVGALADRWLDDGAWPFRRPWAWSLGLAPLVVFFPVGMLALAGLVVHTASHAVPGARRLATSRAITTTARAALTVLFVLALVDLTRDVVALR